MRRPQPYPLRQTEDAFQTDVIQFATLNAWLCYHTHDSRRSAKGFPDLVLVRFEEILYRELKSDTGKVSPDQRIWLDALERAGANAAVWRPADWDEIIATLRRPARAGAAA